MNFPVRTSYDRLPHDDASITWLAEDRKMFDTRRCSCDITIGIWFQLLGSDEPTFPIICFMNDDRYLIQCGCGRPPSRLSRAFLSKRK